MLKHLLIPLFLFGLLFGWHAQVIAQSTELHAVVTMTNGQEQHFYLNEDDQFSFDGQDILVISTQGSTTQLNLDDIRKIEFIDVTGTQELQAGEPFFYPNPVNKTIVIGNIENGQTVSIYSIEGRLLRQFKANANEPIDLSDLPSGMYVLNTSDKNLKLLKL